MITPELAQKNRLLLVESRDPKELFIRMLRRQGIQDVQVMDFGGVSQLRGYLGALKAVDGFEQVRGLAIIRDAETSARNAFISVRNALKAQGLPAPTALERRRPVF